MMKKILISTAIILSASGIFAQEKLVNKALSDAKAEKPNFKEARENIATALGNPESKDLAKTWYAAGFIENRSYEAERNKQILNQKANEKEMYTALAASVKYFVKAAELDQLPDVKGKVKPKYLKEIKTLIKSSQSSFINAGAYFWDLKDYQIAYDMFHNYTEIPKLEVMQGEEFVVDSNFYMIQYYEAIAASQIPNPKLAIASYEALKGTGYKENEIYQYLAHEYLAAGDTVNYSKTLEEGAIKFPSEAYYIQTLINIYINGGEFDKAINYLDAAIKQDPKNAQFMDVKGRLLEQEKKTEEAMATYKQAIEMDPNFAEAYGNVGRMYYNNAIDENDKAATIRDTRTYNETIANKVKPLFREALPFYEKAHNLKPEEREYMVALRGIYYNLGMGAEYDAIEKKLSDM